MLCISLSGKLTKNKELAAKAFNGCQKQNYTTRLIHYYNQREREQFSRKLLISYKENQVESQPWLKGLRDGYTEWCTGAIPLKVSRIQVLVG
jgi:lantibiotic modifying enzyme